MSDGSHCIAISFKVYNIYYQMKLSVIAVVVTLN